MAMNGMGLAPSFAAFLPGSPMVRRLVVLERNGVVMNGMGLAPSFVAFLPWGLQVALGHDAGGDHGPGSFTQDHNLISSTRAVEFEEEAFSCVWLGGVEGPYRMYSLQFWFTHASWPVVQ